MSYRFKGASVIIEGEEQRIVPGPLPPNPTNGLIAVDQSDNKLKVYHSSKGRWIVLGDAEDVVFNNSVNGFDATNVQAAIEEVKKKRHFLQFQLIDELNYDEYIYSNVDIGNQGLLGSKNRSGNQSNGYRYSNSAPLIAPFTGKVVRGTFAIKGLAVSTGNVGSMVTVNLELWSVGFQNEGTKLGDIDVDVDSGTFTIGNWWNSSVDTNFKGSANYDLSIPEGTLLAVKFIRQQNSTNAVEIRNLTVALELLED